MVVFAGDTIIVKMRLKNGGGGEEGGKNIILKAIEVLETEKEFELSGESVGQMSAWQMGGNELITDACWADY